MSKMITNIGLMAGGALVLGSALVRAFRKTTFKDKVVLIMGGSRGLGLELARLFAREGAVLALVARDEKELERAKGLLACLDTVHTFTCDVSDHDLTKQTIAKIEAELGPIDVLINNAGQIQAGPVETHTFGDYKTMMKTHFWGPLYAIDAVVPSMKKRRSGRIVNISSIGGLISVPHLVPYCASKHALVGLSRGMRSELIKYGILTTTVCPTLMRTGSHVNAEFKGQHRIEYALFSIMDALPFTSINSVKAAQQIVEACRMGDANLIISFPAKLAAAIEALAPNMVDDLFSMVDMVLPGAGDGDTRSVKGKDSQSAFSPSILTKLADDASIRNNELTEKEFPREFPRKEAPKKAS